MAEDVPIIKRQLDSQMSLFRKYPFHLPPHISCPNCGVIFVAPNALVKAYLIGASVSCPDCRSPVNGWEVILSAIRQNHMFTDALVKFGAHSTTFQITMKPQQRFQLIFSDYGIPDAARILCVNYTPNSSSDQLIFPIQVHGNQVPERFIRNETSLYPSVSLGAKSWGVETTIQVHVIWVPPFDEEPLWNSLFEACECYVGGKYANCILPANVAVEAKLSGLLFRYFSQSATKERVDNFLQDGATYSHQLNVILPRVASDLDFPQLSDEIRGLLNRLRKLRNEIAHYGYLLAPITESDAAELICAALFGYQYVQLVEHAFK